MEQLTQMELQQIYELLGAEELALTKCQTYLDQVKDDELQPYIRESIVLHQQHLAQLIDLVRKHISRDIPLESYTPETPLPFQH